MKYLFLVLFCFSLFCTDSSQAQKLQKIDQLLFQENYPAAIQLLKQKTAQAPQNPQLLFRLGKAYQAQQQNLKAIACFEKAYKQDSLSRSTQLALGNCYFASGMYLDAQSLLEKSRQIDSTNISTNLLLAKVYTTQKIYRKASKLYEQLIQQDSLNPYYHKRLGILAGKLRQAQKAMDELKTAHDLNPRDLSSLLLLISSYYEYTVYQKALLYANKGLREYPNYPALLKKKAMILVNLQWFENAQVVLEKLIELKHADANNYKQLGLCYLNAKEYEKALKIFQNISKEFVNDPLINLYLGITLQKLARHTESLPYFEKAEFYSLPNHMASLKLYQARAYDHVKEFGKSVEAYLACHKLDQSNPNLLYDIANAYDELGNNKQEAINYYSQYLNQYQGKDEERKEYVRSRILRLKENIHFEK